MAILRAAYPQFYARKTDGDVKIAVTLWTEMFSDDDFLTVAAAVKSLLKTRESNFPPSIGEVTAEIRRLRHPDEMTAAEAWGLVFRAICNSSYNSAVEFDKLPAQIQRLVGGPAQLAEWAAMEQEHVSTVVASNFQRSYRARVEADNRVESMPSSVRVYIDSLTEATRMRCLGEAGRLENLKSR